MRRRVLSWALAGALVFAGLPGVPARAEANAVYVSGAGSGENSGMTDESPLNSIYAAQELLPDGGTILVTDTIYITDERSYSLREGIRLQAAEELEGPLFEVAESGKLTLNNIVIVGNDSMLIDNSGVLKMDDSVSLLVKDGSGVGCVYTEKSAATYLNGELVAGDASVERTEKETESETGETSGMETESETETGQGESEPEKEAESETDQSESEPETEEKATEAESGSEAETEAKPQETEEASETEQKQSETSQTEAVVTEPETEESVTVETEPKQEENGKGQTDKTETGKEEISKTETRETEDTGNKAPGKEEVIREAAVEAVRNAIVSLNIHSREDVRSLLAVSQAYDGLTEAEKKIIPVKVRQLLKSAKNMAAAYNHTQLGVSVYGNLPWYVQFRVKMTDVSNKEENGLKILVPYELKLWNLYTDSVYHLPEGESVTVTMPVPDVEIQGEFTVFHYKSDGSVESIKPVIRGNMMSFQTTSFSPFSVAGSTVITGIGIGSGTPSDGGSSGDDDKSTGSAGNTSYGSSNSSQNGSGGSTGSQNTSGSTGNYNTAVNTGDDTNILPMAVTALAALLVIAGILLHKKKEEK